MNTINSVEQTSTNEFAVTMCQQRVTASLHLDDIAAIAAGALASYDPERFTPAYKVAALLRRMASYTGEDFHDTPLADFLLATADTLDTTTKEA